MSISEEQENLLSQLVDGELPVDQANQVLADVFEEMSHVLGDYEVGSRLNAMLQLRQTLGPWRQQEPPKPIVCPPTVLVTRGVMGMWDKLSPVLGLAAAAVLGGILVAGGFYLAGRHGNVPETLAGDKPSTVLPSMITVTSEQRSEIARAFSLHESVAGPLSWYAADDATIQERRPNRRRSCNSQLRLSCGWRRSSAGRPRCRRRQNLRDCLPQSRRGDDRVAAVGGGQGGPLATAPHGRRRPGEAPVRAGSR